MSFVCSIIVSQSAGSKCFANEETMQRCADDIDILKMQKFGEECQCRIRGNFNIKVLSYNVSHTLFKADFTLARLSADFG